MFLVSAWLGCAAEPPAICQQYLTCVAAVAPSELDPIAAAYGDGGSCYREKDLDCEAACATGLVDVRAARYDASCYTEEEADCGVIRHASELCDDGSPFVDVIEDRGCSDPDYDACVADVVRRCEDALEFMECES